MNKKVLVLEDEDNIRAFVVINLKRAGYDTVEFGLGEEAANYAKEFMLKYDKTTVTFALITKSNYHTRINFTSGEIDQNIIHINSCCSRRTYNHCF